MHLRSGQQVSCVYADDSVSFSKARIGHRDNILHEHTHSRRHGEKVRVKQGHALPPQKAALNSMKIDTNHGLYLLATARVDRLDPLASYLLIYIYWLATSSLSDSRENGQSFKTHHGSPLQGTSRGHPCCIARLAVQVTLLFMQFLRQAKHKGYKWADNCTSFVHLTSHCWPEHHPVCPREHGPADKLPG